ncbi:MAG: universal stress protein [Deltaproteobacteria bacterium]|nr:MAG: universal stress protein [Deltaproteobacteria bacterium]
MAKTVFERKEDEVKRKILIAMDDSDNALRAVSFVAEAFDSESEIVLLSVVPKITAACELNADTLAAHFKSQQAAFCQVEEEKEKLLREALGKGKQMLLDAGYEDGKIRMELKQQKKGIARDIVSEAERLDVDLIVLGRRGLSGIKEFFLGSISQKVLQLCKDRSALLVQ